jgi:hypothetical protein
MLRRVGLPTKLGYQFVKGMRILAHPINYARRRRHAKAIVSNSPWRSVLNRRKGFARIGPETLPGTDRVVAICQALYARYLEDEGGGEARRRKAYLVNILDDNTLEENPEVLQFALSEAVVEAVTGYLGSVPILRGIGVYLSPRSETTQGSQMFHTDNDDFRQVKVFINVLDVDERNGPFTLVPADQSRRVRTTLRHGWRDRRLTDEQVLSLCETDDLVQLVGPAGSGGMVDTSNCLHYGSRTRSGPRVVLMFQYTTYPNVALDHSVYSGREGLPLYRFPLRLMRGDPWKQALLGPDIQRTVSRGVISAPH